MSLLVSTSFIDETSCLETQSNPFMHNPCRYSVLCEIPHL